MDLRPKCEASWSRVATSDFAFQANSLWETSADRLLGLVPTNALVFIDATATPAIDPGKPPQWSILAGLPAGGRQARPSLLECGLTPLLSPTHAVGSQRPPSSGHGIGNYYRFARYPSRIEAQRGDHFLQADLSLPICMSQSGLFPDSRPPDCLLQLGFGLQSVPHHPVKQFVHCL